MLHRFVVFSIASALVFPGPAFSQTPRLTPEKIEAIEAYVETTMDDLDVPGVSIALIEDGEIVHASGYGEAAIGGPPVTEATAFQIGSVTKSFTAMAVLLLAEEGRMDLDDAVVEHIPWFATGSAGQSAKITIRHLLSHRSGLSTKTGNRNQADDESGADALEKAVRDLASARLTSPPGERFQYSNANYQILGLLVEVLSGQSYETYTEENILKPLGMADSRVGGAPETVPNAATGHRYWFGAPKAFKEATPRAIVAQGGIWASSRDLAQYLISYMQDEASPLSDISLSEMLSPSDTATASYALGWFVRDFTDYRLVFHTGSNPGFQGVSGFSPDGRFGFVVLMNANGSFGTRNVGALGTGVGNLVMDLQAPRASVHWTERLFFIFVCLIPLIAAGLAAGFLRKWLRGGLKSLSGVGALEVVWRLLVPSAAMFGLAYVLFFIVPAANGATMPAVLRFNPDIGLVLVAGASAAAVFGAARFALRILTRGGPANSG